MQSDRGRSVTKAEVRGNELHREDLRLRRNLNTKRGSIGLLDSLWISQNLNQKSVGLYFNTSFPLKIRTFLTFCLCDKRQRCNKSCCLAEDDIKKSSFWAVWWVWKPLLKNLSVAAVHYMCMNSPAHPSFYLSLSPPLFLSLCFTFISLFCIFSLHQGTYDLWAHLSATIKQSLMKPGKVTFVCTVHSTQRVCMCACLKRASLHVYALWQRLRGGALTSRMVSKSMMSSKNAGCMTNREREREKECLRKDKGWAAQNCDCLIKEHSHCTTNKCRPRIPPGTGAAIRRTSLTSSYLAYTIGGWIRGRGAVQQTVLWEILCGVDASRSF